MHGAIPSVPVLIVSGLGALEEYLFAAAIALRANPGAEVAFASKAALPDVLEEHGNGGYGRVLLLGVGLSGDPARLTAALSALHSTGTTITWIGVAGIPLPASLPDPARKLFEAKFVEEENLPQAVASALGADAADLLSPYNAPGRTAASRAWTERIAAAKWSFANSRDLDPLEGIVRDMADRVPPERWGSAARRLVENFRHFGYRKMQNASPAMRRLRKDIARVAKSAATRILVTGESGVGKETVAQQIHVQSGRRGPFLAFNCATVAKDLLESRLFGHRKGAFTGATENRPGLFRDADGGTLFLDEIAELPLETQGMLLRALQEGRVLGVGETEETPVDVRVVAATNRDLPSLVQERKFREDLYFRLSLVELHVPPLRERTEDLKAIAEDFWRDAAPGRKPLTDTDLAALAAFDWPGNVRELHNVLERAALFPDHTVAELVAEEKERVAALKGGESPKVRDSESPRSQVSSLKSDSSDTVESELLDDVVRAHVRRVLERHGGNVTQAARALGISRNTVREKLGSPTLP